MIVRVWSKPDTQAFIKLLRAKGYTVDKVNNGYVCHFDVKPNHSDLVFKAMIGSRGYLCRINPDYVTETNDNAGNIRRDIIETMAGTKGGEATE